MHKPLTQKLENLKEDLEDGGVLAGLLTATHQQNESPSQE